MSSTSCTPSSRWRRGTPLRISAESLCGTLFVSLCVDPEVVTGVDTLAEGITGSVAELRTAAGSSST